MIHTYTHTKREREREKDQCHLREVLWLRSEESIRCFLVLQSQVVFTEPDWPVQRPVSVWRQKHWLKSPMNVWLCCCQPGESPPSQWIPPYWGLTHSAEILQAFLIICFVRVFGLRVIPVPFCTQSFLNVTMFVL